MSSLVGLGGGDAFPSVVWPSRLRNRVLLRRLRPRFLDINRGRTTARSRLFPNYLKKKKSDILFLNVLLSFYFRHFITMRRLRCAFLFFFILGSCVCMCVCRVNGMSTACLSIVIACAFDLVSEKLLFPFSHKLLPSLTSDVPWGTVYLVS